MVKENYDIITKTSNGKIGDVVKIGKREYIIIVITQMKKSINIDIKYNWDTYTYFMKTKTGKNVYQFKFRLTSKQFVKFPSKNRLEKEEIKIPKIENAMTNKSEAYKIISEQIGYNRLTCMVGAYNPIYGYNGNSFSFRFKGLRNCPQSKKYNHISIILTIEDTYTVVFSKIVKYKITSVKRFDNIYYNQLENLFGHITSMATHL